MPTHSATTPRKTATATASSRTRKNSLSSPGKRDGLYWKTKAGEPPSPLGPLVVRCLVGKAITTNKAGPTPYHGYFYRMLKGQGAAAGSPAFDYVVHGRAIGGFAVVAYPAKYGSSGIMTFIVNQDGKVYPGRPRTEHASQGKRDAALRPGYRLVARAE